MKIMRGTNKCRNKCGGRSSFRCLSICVSSLFVCLFACLLVCLFKYWYVDKLCICISVFMCGTLRCRCGGGAMKIMWGTTKCKRKCGGRSSFCMSVCLCLILVCLFVYLFACLYVDMLCFCIHALQLRMHCRE